MPALSLALPGDQTRESKPASNFPATTLHTKQWGQYLPSHSIQNFCQTDHCDVQPSFQSTTLRGSPGILLHSIPLYFRKLGKRWFNHSLSVTRTARTARTTRTEKHLTTLFKERAKALLSFYSMTLASHPFYNQLTFISSGPSRVGKTLTAEGIAEMKELPLYNVCQSSARPSSSLIISSCA
jgi:hypothetical protein